MPALPLRLVEIACIAAMTLTALAATVASPATGFAPGRTAAACCLPVLA